MPLIQATTKVKYLKTASCIISSVWEAHHVFYNVVMGRVCHWESTIISQPEQAYSTPVIPLVPTSHSSSYCTIYFTFCSTILFIVCSNIEMRQIRRQTLSRDLSFVIHCHVYVGWYRALALRRKQRTLICRNTRKSCSWIEPQLLCKARERYPPLEIP